MAYHFNVFTRSPKYFLWSSQTVFLISWEQEIRRQQTIWKDKIGTLETSKNQLYLILTRKPGKIIFRHENNFFHFLMLLNFLPYFCYGSWCLYIKAPKNIITVKHNRWKKVLLYQQRLQPGSLFIFWTLNVKYIFSMETCIPSLKYIVVVQSQEWGWLGIHTTLEGKKNVDKMLAKFY